MEKRISLTDFIDTVKKSGTRKITSIKKVVDRGEYHPSKDFYRLIRNYIIGYTKGQQSEEEENEFFQKLNQKKVSHYRSILKGYKSFMNRQTFEWLNTPRFNWTHKDLLISINPELGLRINRTDILVKLYFNDEKLSKEDANLILTLMKDSVGSDFDVAILDIRRRKLHRLEGISGTLKALLKGEAELYIRVWEELLHSEAA